MAHESLDRWLLSHDYTPADRSAERRLLVVVALTAVTMVVELVAGWLYGSMALLADGWHMGSHAAALGISAFAYAFARRRNRDPRYSFGTGKVGSLGGFASGVVLAIVSLLMAFESVRRLLEPTTILFDQALVVAGVGLAVNLLSAWLLAGATVGGSAAHRHDHNLRGALLHVMADALTSVAAIAALLGGRFLGWTWLDPAIGLVGAVVIGRWCVGLLRDTAGVLLDRIDVPTDAEEIRAAVETDGDTRIADLHLWTLAPGKRAAIVSIVAHEPASPDEYKARLAHIPDLDHVTVEVNQCCDEEPSSPEPVPR